MTIQGREKRTAFLKFAQPVKTHSVKPLEDVAIFPMLWGAAVGCGKPLDFLEAGDDTFLARRAPALLLSNGEVVEFGA